MEFPWTGPRAWCYLLAPRYRPVCEGPEAGADRMMNGHP